MTIHVHTVGHPGLEEPCQLRYLLCMCGLYVSILPAIPNFSFTYIKATWLFIPIDCFHKRRSILYYLFRWGLINLGRDCWTGISSEGGSGSNALPRGAACFSLRNSSLCQILALVLLLLGHNKAPTMYATEDASTIALGDVVSGESETIHYLFPRRGGAGAGTLSYSFLIVGLLAGWLVGWLVG